MDGNVSINLQRALEAKLSKIEGPDFGKRIEATRDITRNDSICDSPAEILEIANKSSSQNGLIRLFLNAVKSPGRVKYVALVFLLLSLGAVLIFVRKRQLIKRIIS